MKGIAGIIVAVGLGLAGAILNLWYLHNEAQKVDLVSFIGIKKGVVIGRGERLRKDNLVEVKIPRNQAHGLVDYAFPWAEMVGFSDDERVWRTIDSGENGVLLLRDDLHEPLKQLELGKGEMAEGIIAPRNFTTSLVNPGDKVWFRVTKIAPPVPSRAPKPAASAAGAPALATPELQPAADEADPLPPTGGSDILGPFVVVSIGNRLGKPEIMKAAKIAPVQENVVNLRISDNVAGEKDRFNQLWERIRGGGDKSYDILLGGKE